MKRLRRVHVYVLWMAIIAGGPELALTSSSSSSSGTRDLKIRNLPLSSHTLHTFTPPAVGASVT